MAHPGSRMMLLVAFLYSLTSVLGKAAMAYVPAISFGAFYFVLLGGVMLLLMLLHRPSVSANKSAPIISPVHR
ncbi:MAG: hypothetical protein KZQ58_06460 [gamma proteobacterium symbiont of Bathyaustriella thionipta]|nr:hypothetical protein [gamma proteobacterium symbiont of Bathyaustriella thionipta]